MIHALLDEMECDCVWRSLIVSWSQTLEEVLQATIWMADFPFWSDLGPGSIPSTRQKLRFPKCPNSISAAWWCSACCWFWVEGGWIGGKSTNLVCSGKTYTSMYNTMQWSPAASDGAEPAVTLRFSQLQQHICRKKNHTLQGSSQKEGKRKETALFYKQFVAQRKTRAAGVWSFFLQGSDSVPDESFKISTLYFYSFYMYKWTVFPK